MSEPFEVYDNIKPDYEAEGFMGKRDFKKEWQYRKTQSFEDFPDEEDIQWMEKELLFTLDEKDKVINEMSETISKQDEMIQNYRDRVIKLVEQRDRTERVYDERNELKVYLEDTKDLLRRWINKSNMLEEGLSMMGKEIERLKKELEVLIAQREKLIENLHRAVKSIDERFSLEEIEKLKAELIQKQSSITAWKDGAETWREKAEELEKEIERLKTENLQIEGTAKLMYKYKQELEQTKKDSEYHYNKWMSVIKERDELKENLIDVVNQACLMDDNKTLNSWALSAYEDALRLLVVIGEAGWVKEGYTAKWREMEVKE